MEKTSFASCQNYFDRLRRKTREIDEGIERLTETWRTPHLLVGGYAERTAETNACLEEMWEIIRSTGVSTSWEIAFPDATKRRPLLYAKNKNYLNQYKAMYINNYLTLTEGLHLVYTYFNYFAL